MFTSCYDHTSNFRSTIRKSSVPEILSTASQNSSRFSSISNLVHFFHTNQGFIGTYVFCEFSHCLVHLKYIKARTLNHFMASTSKGLLKLDNAHEKTGIVI